MGERRTAASCQGCNLCPCLRQECLLGLCQLPLGTASETGITLHRTGAEDHRTDFALWDASVVPGTSQTLSTWTAALPVLQEGISLRDVPPVSNRQACAGLQDEVRPWEARPGGSPYPWPLGHRCLELREAASTPFLAPSDYVT